MSMVRVTRTSAPARSRWSRPPTRERWSGSSPARWLATGVPVRRFTPMTLVHATIEPGARLDLPWNVDFNALVYVLAGSGSVGRRASRSGWARPPCTAPGTT